MDRLNAPVELSNDDVALVVGRLTLDNVALSAEIERLRRQLAEAADIPAEGSTP
jgi:hypothetical protein